MENTKENTKEKILVTALRLFARDGFEAVSVSTIAGELNMTKGALYKHYKNKRDIFDRIIVRMYEIDAERAKEYQVPDDTYEKKKDDYANTTLENLNEFTKAQFLFWTEDPFASNFRRMLTIEQYRSAEISELYKNCITQGPVQYTEDIFREMKKNGVIKEEDPRELALEYYAPFFLLISLSDSMSDQKKRLEILENHFEHFTNHYMNQGQ